MLSKGDGEKQTKIQRDKKIDTNVTGMFKAVRFVMFVKKCEEENFILFYFFFIEID